MASDRYERRYADRPDVTVHNKDGCTLCGRKDRHEHTYPNWREHLDGIGESWRQR